MDMKECGGVQGPALETLYRAGDHLLEGGQSPLRESLEKPSDTWESCFTLTFRHSPSTSPFLHKVTFLKAKEGKIKEDLKPALYPLRLRWGHGYCQGRAFCSLNPRSKACTVLGHWVTFTWCSRLTYQLGLSQTSQALGCGAWSKRQGLRPPALAHDGP